DTLRRAWRSFDTFDGRYPRAWLLTILRHAHVNGHRRQRPSLLRDPDGTAERRVADTVESAEDVAMINRFQESVETSLAALPESFRQVVVLVDVDGLSYAETARLLDVPEGTVMSRLHRGRAKIREQLAAAGLAPRRRM
ncbi:MAG: sigma-70 family RNA polymerase sigma factor, partial [Trebonia sp.]